MDVLTREEVRHRREADVRMRPHVEANPGRDLDGTHVIEEDEWADHAALRRWQEARDRDRSDGAGPALDQDLDRVGVAVVTPRFVAHRCAR